MTTNRIHIDDFIKDALTIIISKNGEIYTEQKFCTIFKSFERLNETKKLDGQLDADSIKKHYECFFPNLAPKWKNIDIVFNNSLKTEEDFKIQFHPSEQIYFEWITNFLNNKPSEDKCRVLISQFNSWIINSKVSVDVNEIQTWLGYIGIKLSKTTSQFLLEYGLPYCGYMIESNHLFRFGGNTRSIIGLLAFNLKQIENGLKVHPLNESIVLALSRLEYFHCS